MHLRAWIEEEQGVGFTVYWVSSDTPERRPARQMCMDYAQARQRVEREAASLGVEIEWIEGGKDD